MITINFSPNHIVMENALREIFVSEVAGEKNNPRIMEYATYMGAVYPSDETAWCALFANWVLKMSGCHYAEHNLLLARALNVLPMPVPLMALQVGDLVVFHRGEPYGWQGHAGFYLNRTENYLRVLGGNQTNMVKVSEYNKDNFLFARRPMFNPMAVDLSLRLCPECSQSYYRCGCDIT